MRWFLSIVAVVCIPASASVLFSDLGTGGNVYSSSDSAIEQGSGPAVR